MQLSSVRPAFITFCLITASLAAFTVSHAQTEPGSGAFGVPAGATTNYHFAGPNELTIIVNILGGVERPGRYEISRTIDLMNLISLAGGPTERGDLGNVRITRHVKLGGRLERKEISVNIDRLSEVNESDLLLSEGDLVFVDSKSGITLQDVVSFVSTAAVLTTLVITITNQGE